MPPSPVACSDAPSPFQSAILLTDHNENAAVDRSVLRAAGIRQVRVGTSGLEAARNLAASVNRVLPASTTEVVVCLPVFADMSAAEFAALVRAHPLLPHIPLLAVIPQPGEEPHLKQSGFNAVLTRPFTVTILRAQLDALASEARSRRAGLIASLRQQGAVPRHDDFDRQLCRFLPPSRETMTAEAAYREGMMLLRAHQWDKALPYLQKAAADTASQGEAGLAMAALWRARNEPGKVKACLEDALQGFLEAGAWGKAQTLTTRLIAEYPGEPNPLLRYLERRVRSGRLGGLTAIVSMAQDFVPVEAVAAALLGGCEAASRPGAALDALLDALTADEELTAVVRALEKAAGRGPEEQKKRWFWLRRTLTRRRKRAEPGQSRPASGEEEATAPLSDDLMAALPEEESTPADGGAIAPLAPLEEDSEGGLRPSRLPAPLGDAWAVMRGTMRLYHSAK